MADLQAHNGVAELEHSGLIDRLFSKCATPAAQLSINHPLVSDAGVTVAVPAESDPGVSPQAGAGEGTAGAQSEEGDERKAFLLEALRQIRLANRVSYPSLMEATRAAMRQPGQSTAANGGAGEAEGTPVDGAEEDHSRSPVCCRQEGACSEDQEQPASPPSLPSPPPSPAAIAEPSHGTSTAADVLAQPDPSA